MCSELREYNNKYLKNLLQEANHISDEVKKDFGALTSGQLNWKPDETQWSIGQCLDHLITTNRTYLPILESVIEGTNKPPVSGRLPWIATLFGKMILNSVEPDNLKKRKTFNVFLPSASEINKRIVGDFINQQEKLLALILETDDVEHEKVIVRSPVSRFIPYQLSYCCRIIITHEKRHLLQANRVMHYDDFPGAS